MSIVVQQKYIEGSLVAAQPMSAAGKTGFAVNGCQYISSERSDWLKVVQMQADVALLPG